MAREEITTAIETLSYMKEQNPQLKSLDIAIEALKHEEMFNDRKIWITISRRLYDKAIEALERNRWIPCSERLPKAGECVGNVDKYYLVQNEYGDMLVARYTNSEYWEQIYQMKPITDEIVAWMPLPEPYKAES